MNLFNRQTSLKSVLWSALENGSMTVISFLSLIIFAKFLHPRDFGTYSVAISVIEVAGILPNMLFHDALIQRDSATDDHFNSAFTVSIILSIFVCLAMWVGFSEFSFLVKDERFGEVGRILGLGFLVSGPVSILMARQRKEFNFRQLAMRTLVGRTGGAALGIAAAFFGYGLWSLVIQNLAMTILGAATLILLSEWRLRLTSDMRPARELLRFSFASVGSLFVIFVTERIFVVCVGIFLGLEKAGYLNLAFRLINTLRSVSVGAILQVALPSMSRLQFEKERLANAYLTSQTLACTLLYPVFIGLGLLAPEIIRLFFGEKWLPSSSFMLPLSLLIITQAPRMFAPPLLSATGRIAALGFISVSGLAYMMVAIALSRLSSPSIAVAVWMGCEIVYFTISLIVVSRLQIRVIDQLWSMAMPLAASAAMAVSISIVRASLPVDLAVSMRALVLFLSGATTFIGFISVLDPAGVRAVIGLLNSILKRK